MNLRLKTMILVSGISIAATSCGNAGNDTAASESGFRYTVDEFADLKVIRYQVPGWDDLTFSQKEYLYHLAEAAKWGRDIIWDQNCRWNLPIRHALEGVIRNYDGDRNSEEFGNFIIYAKRVFFSNGIHHHYSEDKILPACSRDYFASLLPSAGVEGDSAAELLEVIYNPDFCAQRKYQGSEKDLLTASACNYYEGVTKKEAEAFYGRMRVKDDPHPVSYGLNSRLVRKDGRLCEDVYREDGLYGAAIKHITAELEAAAQCAENDIQRDCIAKLVDYYRTGDLRTWDEYNIAWVRDSVSDIDFVNGFIEDYGDPLGMKAAWEANANFKNVKASKRTETISANAQWFEDNSPVDARFKKSQVKGVSAKVITVACLGGDCYPYTPIGINLPNADWIRKEYGSKSVTIENITDAYDASANEAPKSMLTEFAWDESEIARAKKYAAMTDNLHTDLHECLGHGSGQLLPGTSPGALAEYSSTLEEARADLFALYYMADLKLVELGVLPDAEAYKACYDSYIRNGLFTQFVRVEPGKTNTEAHMQNRKLIADWCYERGLSDNIIEKKVRDGKTYFVINDYQALRGLFGRLLAEIQRIKSEGDYEAGRAIVQKYAVNIDPDLHREVKERYAGLNLKPYGGFLNPTIVPVKDSDGKIIDYRMEYGDDFLGQMMEYGARYSTL